MKNPLHSTLVMLTGIALLAACNQQKEQKDQATAPVVPAWEAANPVVPLPAPPLGIDSKLTDLPEPPTPERVRLGRWLYYDKRLSADATIACASCHHPENAFSEPTPVSTGIRGQKGGRKAPSFINQAGTLYPKRRSLGMPCISRRHSARTRSPRSAWRRPSRTTSGPG